MRKRSAPLAMKTGLSRARRRLVSTATPRMTRTTAAAAGNAETALVEHLVIAAEADALHDRELRILRALDGHERKRRGLARGMVQRLSIAEIATRRPAGPTRNSIMPATRASSWTDGTRSWVVVTATTRTRSTTRWTSRVSPATWKTTTTKVTSEPHARPVIPAVCGRRLTLTMTSTQAIC